jgi:hypothetical protein
VRPLIHLFILFATPNLLCYREQKKDDPGISFTLFLNFIFQSIPPFCTEKGFCYCSSLSPRFKQKLNKKQNDRFRPAATYRRNRFGHFRRWKQIETPVWIGSNTEFGDVTLIFYGSKLPLCFQIQVPYMKPAIIFSLLGPQRPNRHLVAQLASTTMYR